jgi:hypothetical protein
MVADPQSEISSRVVPVRKSRLRIKMLMIVVGLVAAVLGWVHHIDRAERAFRKDQAVFASWIAVFRSAPPAFQPAATLVKSFSSLTEMGRRCQYEFWSPAGQLIGIVADFRYGPFHADRQVIFVARDRTVNWPFEDVVRGRKVDLKAEFPGAFR